MQYSDAVIDAQLENKKLFLTGEFDDELLINFCTMISKGVKPETELWINSHGGGLSILFGLRDIISLERNITKVVGFGAIYSAAAYLITMLPAWQEKFMTPNCEMMMHKVTAAAVGEHEFEHKNNYLSMRRSNFIIEEHFKKVISSLPKKEYKKMFERFRCGEDIYFNAEECLSLNMIDGIMDIIAKT